MWRFLNGKEHTNIQGCSKESCVVLLGILLDYDRTLEEGFDELLVRFLLMALEDLLVLLGATFLDLRHQQFQALPSFKARGSLRLLRIKVELLLGLKIILSRSLISLWFQETNKLQEVVNKKRHLDPENSLFGLFHFIEGFEENPNQDQDQMLFGAEHSGALANLAFISAHLLGQARLSEENLESCHLLAEDGMLLGYFGQDAAAFLYFRKDVA
jgi:hypothetical protein